ncbi:hypothetical protein [Paracoccus sp. MC1862]|uniref:hypothetical protein n=1 Tax=Paracoccus sp. MC1862 TaxID=2760307 RepID=UPI00190D52D1|nr:hypothetical protein [Paracoccus sp. MC1862]QQO45397.1 hypothetical protein JGR78_03295 [Paracoccus sp. MC1862]
MATATATSRACWASMFSAAAIPLQPGGADLSIDAGLPDARLVTDRTVIIDGESSFTLDAGTLDVASVLTDLRNETTIAFSRSGPGTFTEVRPAIGILASAFLTIDEIGPGDRLVIPIDGQGIGGLNTLREASYSDGSLNLVNGSALNQVDLCIGMTQEQYALYRENPGAFLNGATDTFTFPGAVDPDEPPNEVSRFTRGTLIETGRGLVAVEDLAVGRAAQDENFALLP